MNQLLPALALGSVAFLSGFLGARGIAGVAFGLAGGIVAGLVAYTSMPALALDFGHLPTQLIIAALPGVASAFYRMSRNDGGPGRKPGYALAGTLLTVGFAWYGGLILTSLGVMNPQGYRDNIEVVEKPLDATVELIDQTHARLVDQSLAHRRAMEKLGTEKGLGSSYTVGTPRVQMVGGNQTWVAPLEPVGFFVWLTGKPSPGYVAVSATNYSEARIVLDHPMRVTREMWFGDNVERVAYAAAPTRGQSDPMFETDDEGRPYWVVSLFHHAVGGAAPKVDGVLLVDASDGKVTTYALDAVPAWVDRIQPEWISETQLRDWGDYVHGYWNFSGEDVVHPTEGMSLVNLRDGRSAWFTGIVNARSQSRNAAATNGFALVDARTGAATVYYEQGVSESAAQAALEGMVQDKRYAATTPIAYLVHGTLTYVATLKDASGNPRLVGMVSALDRSVAATGETLEDVTRLYVSRLQQSSLRAGRIGPDAVPATVSGTVVRSGELVVEGHGYQYVRVDQGGGVTRDYTVDHAVIPLREAVLARAGDRIDLEVATSSDGVTEVRGVKVFPAP